MSPLIDCIFLLLIFFLISSTFLTPKIQLSLPKASTTVSTNEPDFVMVTIDAQGAVYLNSQVAAWHELGGKLTERLRGSPRKVVTLRCDASTPHKYFVRALDIAKSSGATHVNVAHETEEKG
jgi:biopolymer transport protein ExbD